MHQLDSSIGLSDHNLLVCLQNTQLFENRPALYFFNYTFIYAYKIFFLFRIKDTDSDILSVLLDFIANYDCKNENIPPYCL